MTCPVSMLAMQELGCFQLPGIVYRSLQHGPCIIMLQHKVMVVDEWHNKGPQDLVTERESVCVCVCVCLCVYTYSHLHRTAFFVYLGKGEVLINTALYRFVNNI